MAEAELPPLLQGKELLLQPTVVSELLNPAEPAWKGFWSTATSLLLLSTAQLCTHLGLQNTSAQLPLEAAPRREPPGDLKMSLNTALKTSFSLQSFSSHLNILCALL